MAIFSKGDMAATEANTAETVSQICTKNQKSNRKNSAVERKLLSIIEVIYTQFSKLCAHKMLWIADQPVSQCL